MQTRTIGDDVVRVITVRITKDEYDRIKEAAYQSRKSMNCWYAESLLKAASVPARLWAKVQP